MVSKSIAILFLHLQAMHILEAAPMFTVSPQAIEYISPNATLDVVCTTRNPSSITWHENDASKTLITSKFSVTTISDRSSRLHLANANVLTLPDLNTGRFCRATDASDGSVTDSTVFTLNQGAAPTIGTAPKNSTEIVEGNQTTLTCSFGAGVLPAPEIFWKFAARGGTEIVDVGTPTTGNMDNNLVLSNIRRNEAGTYTCHVRNEFGNVSASAIVTVLYKPTVTVSFTPSSTVKKGSSVTVTCRSDSFPVASVHSLFRNGVVIPENSPTTASNTPTETIIEWSYVIMGSNETEGKYVCEVNNTVGSGQSSEQELVVLLPPEAPTVVASDAFDVCWSAGFLGRPPISNFSVSCTSNVNGACSKKPAEFNSEVPATNFTTVNNITGVLCTNVSGPSANYMCTISANNGAFNVNTPPTDVSTRPGKPGPVQISEATNAINTGFTLSWCVEFSGSMNPLTSTIIGVSADKAASTYNPQTQQGSTVVTGLEPNAEYKVQIRVTNSLGEAVSNELTQRTTCVPDALNATDATATIDNEGIVTITFTDARTGPCNLNNEYVIRDRDTIWATMPAEPQDDIVTITFKRAQDVLSDTELTIVTRNGNDESQPSAAVSLQQLPQEPSEGPVVGPTATDEPDNGNGGLSTGVIVAIIVPIVIVIIIVIIVAVCVYKQREDKPVPPHHRDDHGTDGNFKKTEHPPASPGPNSGSSYPPSSKSNAPEPRAETTYAELELGEKESTPVQSPPKRDTERVEYASIDRDASRRHREAKKAEEEAATAAVGSPDPPKGQPDETELSTMV